MAKYFSLADVQNINSVKLSRVAMWLVIIAITIAFLINYKGLLQPFVFALVVWYLITEVKHFFGRIKVKGKPLPMWIRGAISFIMILSLIYAVVEILMMNIELITTKLPAYEEKAQDFLRQLENSTGVNDLGPKIVDRLEGLDLRNFLTGTLGSLTSFVGNFILIIIYLVFMLIEESIFSRKMKMILPKEQDYQRAMRMIHSISGAITSYLSVKTNMSLLTGFLSYIVLLLFGVDFAFLWAFLIFLFNYIPYIGSFVATLLPSVFAVFQFGSFLPFIWIFAGVEAIQILVGNYIEPKVMGKTLNLSPLVVIVALSFWGAIWGVLGMLLSVPITSIMVIVMAQFRNTRKVAVLLSENADITNMVVENTEDGTEVKKPSNTVTEPITT